MKKYLIVILLFVSCEEVEIEPEKSITNETLRADNSITNLLSNTLVMDAHYENGLEDSGLEIGENTPGPYRRMVVSTLKRSGNYSIMHKLNISDPEDAVAGSMRSESHNMDMIEARIWPGQIRYYGFSIYFPSTWETDGMSDDIVFQWKGFDGPPFMFLTQKHNSIFLRYNYNTNPIADSGTIVKNSTIIAPLTKGRWHDFRFRVVWEYEDNGVGRIEVDHKLDIDSNYTRVFNYIGPNMFNKNGYLKWGIYKPSWDKDEVDNYVDSVFVRAIWHDNIKVGSSWSEIDPGN